MTPILTRLVSLVNRSHGRPSSRSLLRYVSRINPRTQLWHEQHIPFEMTQPCIRLLRSLCREKGLYRMPLGRHLSTTSLKATRLPQALPDARRTSLPTQNLPTSKIQGTITPEQRRRQFRADKIFESGIEQIYRAPSHVGLLLSTYLVAGSCFSVALGLYFTGHWSNDPNSELPFFVPVSWRLGMVLFTTASGLIIIRTMRFITALDLVKQNGMVNLKVTVRRVIPFLKPSQYTVSPWEFKIDRRIVTQFDSPAWLSSESGSKPGFGLRLAQALSKLFYYPFASFRRLLIHDGIAKVTIDNSANWARLDMSGKFSNGGKDLFEIVAIEMRIQQSGI